jgi:hypothetical protein
VLKGGKLVCLQILMLDLNSDTKTERGKNIKVAADLRK